MYTETEMKIRRLEAKAAGYKTNHILHLLLSILTGGLWLIVWLFMAINNWVGRSSTNAKINRLISRAPEDERDYS